MARLNLEIPRAEQDVEAARGEGKKKDARHALKDLDEAVKISWCAVTRPRKGWWRLSILLKRRLVAKVRSC